jgi:DNA-binding transcriptional LysR family regulator
MELRHFRYFLSVAKYLNFTKAAAELNVSQPPLSRQVKDLERELGVELFIRDQTGVRLTPAGEFLKKELQPIMDDIASLCRATRMLGNPNASSLRIGCVNSLSANFMPSLMRYALAAFPDLVTDIRIMYSKAQSDALKSGTIDLGIVRSWIDVSGISFKPLFDESLTLVFPLSWTASTDPKSALRELKDKPMAAISVQAAPGLAGLTREICRDAGIEPRATTENSDLYAILRMVASGLMWAIVPDLALEDDTFAGIGRIDTGRFTTIGFCWRAKRLDPKAKLFMDIAFEYMEDFHQSGVRIDQCHIE